MMNGWKREKNSKMVEYPCQMAPYYLSPRVMTNLDSPCIYTPVSGTPVPIYTLYLYPCIWLFILDFTVYTVLYLQSPAARASRKTLIDLTYVPECGVAETPRNKTKSQEYFLQLYIGISGCTMHLHGFSGLSLYPIPLINRHAKNHQ